MPRHLVPRVTIHSTTVACRCLSSVTCFVMHPCPRSSPRSRPTSACSSAGPSRSSYAKSSFSSPIELVCSSFTPSPSCSFFAGSSCTSSAGPSCGSPSPWCSGCWSFFAASLSLGVGSILPDPPTLSLPARSGIAAFDTVWESAVVSCRWLPSKKCFVSRDPASILLDMGWIRGVATFSSALLLPWASASRSFPVSQ